MELANSRAIINAVRPQTAARAGLDSLAEVEGHRNVAMTAQVTAYDDTGIAGRAIEIRLAGDAALIVMAAIRHALETTIAGADETLSEHMHDGG